MTEPTEVATVPESLPDEVILVPAIATETNVSRLDERTRVIETQLVNILKYSNDDMRPIVLDGGLAIELYVADRDKNEEFYRNHGDMDIRPMEEDIPYWKDKFKQMGFEVNEDIPNIDKSKAFEATMALSDGQLLRIDVWGLKVNNEQRVSSAETGVEIFYDQKWSDLVKKVEWRGSQAFIINPEIVLVNKSEYAKKKGEPLRRGDVIDYQRAGIDLPIT